MFTGSNEKLQIFEQNIEERKAHQMNQAVKEIK